MAPDFPVVANAARKRRMAPKTRTGCLTCRWVFQGYTEEETLIKCMSNWS